MKRQPSYPIAVDLFAGAGGLSEGLESAGIRTVLAQELHPQPALTLGFNHPHSSVIVGDIRNLSLDLMRKVLRDRGARGEIDVLAGGPPCQGFSTAGKKNEQDPRNNLFAYFCKVAAELRPKVILLENVPGFKGMYGGKVYQEATSILSGLGYRLSDRILNACDYGVPQRRQRFVLVGVRDDIKADFEWPAPTHSKPEELALSLFSPILAPPVTVGEALDDLSFVQPGFEAHQHQLSARSSYQRNRRGLTPFLFNHLTTRHRERAIEIFKHIPEGRTIAGVPDHIKSAKRTMARLARDQVSNAILALPDDLIHYEQHRIPSVREMARLQSFDDDFVFFGKRTSGFMERKVDVPQYTQVGNAVPPLLGKALGEAIIKLLGGSCTDLRDRGARRERVTWVRGSSGYAGYVLGSEADICLIGIDGQRLQLPVDDSQPRITDLPPLIEWKAEKRTGLKRQWAPGVLVNQPKEVVPA